AEELRTVLDQYTRKEISLKDVLAVLRPEIEGLAQRLQDANTAAGTPVTGTNEQQTDAFVQNRLRSDAQVLVMLRTCLNDAEKAAGMWERKKSKPPRRPRS